MPVIVMPPMLDLEVGMGEQRRDPGAFIGDAVQLFVERAVCFQFRSLDVASPPRALEAGSVALMRVMSKPQNPNWVLASS